MRAASKERPSGTASDAAAKWRHRVLSQRRMADCVSALMRASAQKQVGGVSMSGCGATLPRLVGGSGSGSTRRKRCVSRPMRRANESRMSPCWLERSVQRWQQRCSALEASSTETTVVGTDESATGITRGRCTASPASASLGSTSRRRAKLGSRSLAQSTAAESGGESGVSSLWLPRARRAAIAALTLFSSFCIALRLGAPKLAAPTTRIAVDAEQRLVARQRSSVVAAGSGGALGLRCPIRSRSTWVATRSMCCSSSSSPAGVGPTPSPTAAPPSAVRLSAAIAARLTSS